MEYLKDCDPLFNTWYFQDWSLLSTWYTFSCSEPIFNTWYTFSGSEPIFSTFSCFYSLFCQTVRILQILNKHGSQITPNATERSKHKTPQDHVGQVTVTWDQTFRSTFIWIFFLTKYVCHSLFFYSGLDSGVQGP